MTGYRSRHFRHSCEAAGCYVAGLPSWDWFIDEAFPRNIRPTDIDGMVEINDHLLFLEEKQAGKHIDEGQRKALLKLSKRPRVTVMLFRPGKASDYEVLLFPECDGWQPYTRDEFLTWLKTWATNAETSYINRSLVVLPTEEAS